MCMVHMVKAWRGWDIWACVFYMTPHTIYIMKPHADQYTNTHGGHIPIFNDKLVQSL